MPDQTPMMKQYLAIKEKHQDAILFFRLGDFYEMFFDDAEVASKALDLVLTGRGKDENRMPMCGIPYHASQNYIARLIDQGFKVAICEQVEDPKDAKGVVKREVVRIITPGTVIESNLLKEKTNNYLLAITKEKNKYGLAYIDASTGEFKLTELENKDKLLDEINRVNPAELLISDMLTEEVTSYGLRVTSSEFQDTYDTEAAEEKLKSFFKVKSLDSFGLENAKAAWGAAVAILEYLKETQKSSLDHINSIQAYQTSDFMFIDAATRRNLELVQTIRDKYYQGSLLWVLDKTKTSMGGRLLRQWLLQPLLNADKINNRLEAVDELFNNTMLRAELATEIKAISDIERIVGRIAAESANARDLMALKESLRLIPKLKGVMCNVESVMLKKVKDLSDFEEIVTLLTCSIVEDPPFILKDGGLIKDGYNQELDEIKSAAREGKDWIAHLETEERKRTGIKSIKVGFTRVFGYYIEVTNSNLAQIPDNYIRKQTLTNCERYITPELKEKEALVLNADEKIKELEYNLFCEIREEVSKYTLRLQEIAHILAALDVFIAFADIASYGKYCRPKFSSDADNLHPYIHLIDSRHPVVEKSIGEHNFISNNIEINEESRFLLITGPNMAGKSTIMKQAALILIMAQMGSFVPAKEANLSVTDRIFTRIGAMDDIFSGQSTFMLEMTETANILNNATNRSFIILDEIGRGTSTFDGMSIAAAVAEYIHKNIKARTMFATHYHEITQLADKHRGMKNFNVAVKEENDHITFLHKIINGPADKSYGIQVARLAGLPVEVVLRSKEIYSTLEMVENNLGENSSRSKEAFTLKKIGKSRFKREEDNQVSLF